MPGTRAIGHAINAQLCQLPGAQIPIEPVARSLRRIVSLLPGLESQLQLGLAALVPAAEELSLRRYLEQLGRLMDLMEGSGWRGFYRCARNLMRLVRLTDAWARMSDRCRPGGPMLDAAAAAAGCQGAESSLEGNLLGLARRLAGEAGGTVGAIGAIQLQFSVAADSDGTAFHCHCVTLGGGGSGGGGRGGGSNRQPAAFATREVRTVRSAAEAEAAIQESARRFRELGGPFQPGHQEQRQQNKKDERQIVKDGRQNKKDAREHQEQKRQNRKDERQNQDGERKNQDDERKNQNGERQNQEQGRQNQDVELQNQEQKRQNQEDKQQHQEDEQLHQEHRQQNQEDERQMISLGQEQYQQQSLWPRFLPLQQSNLLMLRNQQKEQQTLPAQEKLQGQEHYFLLQKHEQERQQLLPPQEKHKLQENLQPTNLRNAKPPRQSMQKPNHTANQVQKQQKSPMSSNTQEQKASLMENQHQEQEEQEVHIRKQHREQQHEEQGEQDKLNLPAKINHSLDQSQQEINRNEPQRILHQKQQEPDGQMQHNDQKQQQQQSQQVQQSPLLNEKQLDQSMLLLEQLAPECRKQNNENEKQSLDSKKAESEQRLPLPDLSNQLLLLNQHEKQQESQFQKQTANETEQSPNQKQHEQLQSQLQAREEPQSVCQEREEHPQSLLQNHQQEPKPQTQSPAKQLCQKQQQGYDIEEFRMTKVEARIRRRWALESSTNFGDAATVVATCLSESASDQPDRTSSRAATMLEEVAATSGSIVEEDEALRNLLLASVTSLQGAHLASISQPDLASTRTQTTSCESDDDLTTPVNERNDSEVWSAVTKLAIRRDVNRLRSFRMPEVKSGKKAKEAPSNVSRGVHRHQSARVLERGERHQRKDVGTDDAALATPSKTDRRRVSASGGVTLMELPMADKHSAHHGGMLVGLEGRPAAPKEARSKIPRSENKGKATEGKRGGRILAKKSSPIPLGKSSVTNDDGARSGEGGERKKRSREVGEAGGSKPADRAPKSERTRTESRPKSAEKVRVEKSRIRKDQVKVEMPRTNAKSKPDAEVAGGAGNEDTDVKQRRKAPTADEKELEKRPPSLNAAAATATPGANGVSNKTQPPPAGPETSRTERLERLERPALRKEAAAAAPNLLSASNSDAAVATRVPTRAKDKVAKVGGKRKPGMQKIDKLTLA